MRFLDCYISSLLLASALAAPVTIMAAPEPKDDGVQRAATPRQTPMPT